MRLLPALPVAAVIRLTGLLGLLLTAAVAGGQDSYHLFESGHVRPLALSPSGSLLFAVNTPDNRLEVLDVRGETIRRAGETRVGLEPVAVTARSESEVYVVNHLSDSVSVVDVSDPGRPFVKATLPVGDEPRDVVVGGPRRDRIFVTTAHRGQSRPGVTDFHEAGKGRGDVWIFDARALRAPHRILTLFCDTPRGLAVSPDGKRVYAAAFHSGNRTTVLNDYAVDPSHERLLGDGFEAHGLPAPRANKAGVPGPKTALIVRFDGKRWVDSAGRDWAARVRLSLPDQDVFTIDAEADPPGVLQSVSGVGTSLFNLTVNPADGRVFVSNLESRNHVRFKPVLNGHVVENRVTIVEGGSARPVLLNPHIDRSRRSGDAKQLRKSLALPMGLEFSSDGRRLYLCAMGSGLVAVLDGEGAVLERIAVGGGPTGLVLQESTGRLFVSCRFDHAISVVDLERRRVVERIRLRHDPEPSAIRTGRPLLYDARFSSGHGDSSCASCHIFGDLDSLAWDLGDPGGEVRPNPLVRPQALAHEPLLPFHPLKGPMTTLSLRGMIGAGPMHWRGDNHGGPGRLSDERLAFLESRPAFQALLGRREAVSEEAMERLWGFVSALRYPPNPNAPIDGTLTPSQAAGREIFLSEGNPNKLGGSGTPCTHCHVLPLGTGGLAVRTVQQDFKVPHLRNLYQKLGMYGYAVPGIHRIFPYKLEARPTPHLGDQVRGFGYTNDGAVPSLYDFFVRPMNLFAFKDEPERSGRQKVRELEAFLLSFPTGLAPVVGQQVTLDASSPPAAHRRLRVFVERAEAGDGDLVLHGLLKGVQRGWLYGVEDAQGEASRKRFLQSDRRRERIALSRLQEAVKEGKAVVTALVVPLGSGRRIAIDRDEDGALDGDEVDQGLDPADPTSRP